MILRDLRVCHWRGLGELALPSLAPGLNLVLGRNESGKSRLVEALWFSLFESSKGKAEHKRALQGWGSAEGPVVETTFSVAGETYRVEKRFVASPYTVLEGPGRTWKGEEAEARLSELLGTAASGGRRADPAGLGLWPLLWVRQFEGAEAPHRDLNDATRARLEDLLAREVGRIAVGPRGLAVLERARQEAGRYWTATGRATLELRDAQEAAARCRGRWDEARRRKGESEAVSSELARTRRELEGLAERLALRRKALTRARERAAEAERALQDLRSVEAEIRVAEAGAKAARETHGLRVERDGALAKLEAEGAAAAGEARGLAARVEEALGKVASAEAGVRRAEEAHREAKEVYRRAVDQGRRTEAAGQLEALEGRRSRVDGLEVRLAELARAVGSLAVDGESAKRVRALASAWEKARAGLAGAAARLEVHAHRSLDLSDGPLGEGERQVWTCAEPTTVEIRGVATVSVVPGGEGLTAVRDEERVRRAGLEEALAEVGLPSPEAVENQWGQRQELEREIGQVRGLLDALCPEGTSELAAQVGRARAVLAALGEGDGTAPGVEEAREAVDAAADAERQARAVRDGASEALGALRVEAGRVEQRAKGLREERERLLALLHGMPPAADLEARLRGAERGREELLGAREGLKRSYEELGGPGSAGDVEREQAAADALEAQRGELEGQRLRLEGRLSALEGEALHEEEQEAAAASAAAQQALERVERRAAAVRRLLEALEGARREAQERLTAPVRNRVEPYLRQVFPGSSLSLTETWEVAGLETANLAEPFLELSGGAREQLAVIVRVGLAELLAGEHRLPLVLDDALTNTDFERVERIHRVLFQAAKRLQVLVFSCHEEAYDGLGADRTFRLPGGRGVAAP